MRSSRLSGPLLKTQSPWHSADTLASFRGSYACSCSAPLYLSSLRHFRRPPHYDGKKSLALPDTDDETDHRSIGVARSLFTTDPSSPGTPFFLPAGTHIFQKLTSFLRAQYPMLGFQEVLTPTIYKEMLWRQSGHWENYKDDMFMVNSPQRQGNYAAAAIIGPGDLQAPTESSDLNMVETYGLKPMNCPGHCILFRSKRRTYKELPIRYAEFSPLHRNEISGALSGLTRVRRFHQDDGHIFCRPSQVMDEVVKSLQFVKLVYRALRFETSDLHFILSTRPKEGYIGAVEEWDMAEAQLKKALAYDEPEEGRHIPGTESIGAVEECDMAEAQLKEALDSDESEEGRHIPWTESEGDGAFYGPKIDVMLRDSDGKQHQTATIQLDFQLPKRFQLEYDAPAPDFEARGLTTDDPVHLETMGRVTPVMIHRAILGSLERFIALVLERDHGKLPFWLSPRQMIILTVSNNEHVVAAAQKAKVYLSNIRPDIAHKPRKLNAPTYIVDLDASGDSIAQKVARAKSGKYNFICVMGMKNIQGPEGLYQMPTMDVEVNRAMQPELVETWNHIRRIKPGSQARKQKDRGVGGFGGGGSDGVRLTIGMVKELMTRLCDDYL